jgi:hypothetical protein
MGGRTASAVLVAVVSIAVVVSLGAAAEGSSVAFTQSQQAFASQRTSYVALGDLDGDGDLDAVFANMERSPSQIWLNDGAGHLIDSGQTLTSWGHGVGLGDFDQDGDLDLFITCASYAYRSRLYLNDGDGVFVDSGHVLPDRSSSGNGVQLADFDGDRDLDVLVEYYEQPDVIYLNDGRGGLSASDLSVPEEATPGDLDGDGDVDLFVKEHGIGYRVLLNDGSGLFTPGSDLTDPRASDGGVALGDIDADGDLDAIVANGDGSVAIPTLVLLNDGAGRFSDAGLRLGPTAWGFPVLGDLNGDGSLDLIVTNFGLPGDVWLNDGTGNFIEGPQLGRSDASLSAALGDLNGDGALDVLIACFADCSNTIWFNATPSS